MRFSVTLYNLSAFFLNSAKKVYFWPNIFIWPLRAVFKTAAFFYKEIGYVRKLNA